MLASCLAVIWNMLRMRDVAEKNVLDKCTFCGAFAVHNLAIVSNNVQCFTRITEDRLLFVSTVLCNNYHVVNTMSTSGRRSFRQ